MRYVVIRADTFQIDKFDTFYKSFGPIGWKDTVIRFKNDTRHKYHCLNCMSIDIFTLQKKINKTFKNSELSTKLKEADTKDAWYYVIQDKNKVPVIVLKQEKDETKGKPVFLYVIADYDRTLQLTTPAFRQELLAQVDQTHA